MSSTSLKTVWATILLAAWAGIAAAAGTPEQKCQGGKNEAAGKYAMCRAKAERKQLLTGDGLAYTKSISRCGARYSAKWQVLEDAALRASTTCPSLADESIILGEVAACSNKVALLLSANGRFTDNADGTISDRVTGLMWEKKVGLGGGENFANPEAADNSHPWAGKCTISASYCQPTAAAAGACVAGAVGAPVGCAQCAPAEGTCDTSSVPTVWEWLNSLNASSLATYDDWRVPTVSELESLADRTDATPPCIDSAFHGASCGAACTDITNPACACTQQTGYWTATCYAPDPTTAWLVSGYGFAQSHVREVKLNVRAVRGGS